MLFIKILYKIIKVYLRTKLFFLYKEDGIKDIYVIISFTATTSGIITALSSS